MAGQWVDDCGVVDEADSQTPLPSAETWHLIEIHVKPADPLYEVYIDGALLFSADSTRDPADANSVMVGLWNDVITPTSFAYITDVKAGTTRGASDLFAEDFSGGTLVNFDGTYGTVSVVSSPSYAGSGANANAMLADSTGGTGTSTAWKNLASPEPEVWLSVVAGFDASALAGWTAGAPNDLYSGDFGDVFTDTNPSSGLTLNGGVYITALADSGPPVVYEPPLWRYVVTNRDLEVVTFLDSLATSKRMTFELNQPAMATGLVPSDSPEVNILQAGHPFVDEGRRFLLGFRREGGTPPWTIRYAGIILQIEDSADEASSPAAHSTITAWDPWKYLYYRPVVRADGSLPGPAGETFTGLTGNQIATTLLDRTTTYHGETHIMTGTVQTTDSMPPTTFSQGMTVGEAWAQLCQSGNMDIVLRPVYDPITNPGKLVALNISPQAGRPRYKAGMAWGAPGETLRAISRLVDGTQRANKYQGHIGQGGPAADVLQTDATSVANYGEYWAQEWFPGSGTKAVVAALAAERLLVRKNGVTTYRVSPLSEPSPRPFIDYFLGDCVPVYADARLRQATYSLQRILAIPIDVDDNGTEVVTELGFSQDGSACA